MQAIIYRLDCWVTKNMSIPPPEYCTVEDAVARLINFDYVPAGLSLVEMTAAFVEEADVQLHNAQIDGLPEAALGAMQSRRDACHALHTLTNSLLKCLTQEAKKPDTSIATLHDDDTGGTLVRLDSVANWSTHQFGLALPDWSINERIHRVLEYRREPQWEDVTIKIYKDYRIGYKFDGEGFRYSSFQAIGLMGVRKHEPNKLGGILIGLSRGKKFPVGKRPENGEKTALTNLRSALKTLTGIDSEPFYPINEGDGWKPRFKLIDDRRNADERAKKKAVHTDIKDHDLSNEAKDFEDEDDDAGRFLQGMDSYR